MSDYAIIKVGGKQYRVREGEWLLVDRVPYEEGKTFHPDLLLLGGDGDPKFGEGGLKGEQVTAKVTAHVLGEKIVVGKHKRRTGYRRRKGHRSRLSRIEIETIGTRGSTPSSTQRKKASATATAKKESTTAAKKPAAKKATTKEKND